MAEKKSDIIREFIAKHPEMKTGDMVEILQGKYPDLKFTTVEVSGYKSKAKKAAAESGMSGKGSSSPPEERKEQEPQDRFSYRAPITAATVTPSPATRTPSSLTNGEAGSSLSAKIALLKEAIHQVGGLDEARKIMELMANTF